jgi:hypothetical protein
MTESNFLPGNPNQCDTCIFKHGGYELEPEEIGKIYQYLCQGTQHVCHTNRNYACRGGRDIQLRLLTLLGELSEPTDKELKLAIQRFNVKK